MSSGKERAMSRFYMRGGAAGETVAVDCREVPKNSLADELKGCSDVLLYGLGGFSDGEIIEIARTAREAGCGTVKIELSAAERGRPVLFKRLLSKCADEVFVVLPEFGGKAASKDWKRAVEMLKEISSHVKGGLKAKAQLHLGHDEPEKMLFSIASAKVKHVVLSAEGAPAGPVSKPLLDMLKRFAERRDVTVELSCRGERWVFRGRSLRAWEAEALFLEVPCYELSGRRVPLGAVFHLNFACNQHCVFCTADRTLPPVGAAAAGKMLDSALRMDVPRVVFTGGEPTLDKKLIEYIKKCGKAGVEEIAVYTNGMAFREEQYARELAGAGLNFALVSLHSDNRAVSDRITMCGGGFSKTVGGIENLLSAGVFTVINYVVNSMNYEDTPRFVNFVADSFPGAALNFSYAAPIMEEAAARTIVPRFGDAAPYLIEALDACDARRVNATGLEPHWGVPPCALGGDWRRYLPLLPPLSGPYSGFVKGEACAGCGLGSSCPGVRKNYASLYGTGELIPF